MIGGVGMKGLKCGIAVCLFLLVFNKSGYASGYGDFVDNLDIRPDIGYGYAVSKDHERGMGYHAGFRILSNVRSLSTATPDKRWGIEIAAVSPFESKASLSHEKYIAVGLMVEQTLSDQFVVTVGTLGYIGIDQNKNKPFGLLTEIGWEPKFRDNSHLFAAVRYETIYDTSTITRYSLSLGMKFNLY
jgi:hypothetical protein